MGERYFTNNFTNKHLQTIAICCAYAMSKMSLVPLKHDLLSKQSLEGHYLEEMGG